MNTYDFLGIRISSGGAGDDIQIVSTDEDVVKWFTGGSSKIIINCSSARCREKSFLREITSSLEFYA